MGMSEWLAMISLIFSILSVSCAISYKAGYAKCMLDELNQWIKPLPRDNNIIKQKNRHDSGKN